MSEDLLSEAMMWARRLERSRDRRGYGHRFKDLKHWRGRSNAPRRYRPITELDLSAELEHLRLPLIMPDEVPGSPYVAALADWREGLYFRPDGSLIKHQDSVLEWAQIPWSEKRIAATTLFRGGTRIWVVNGLPGHEHEHTLGAASLGDHDLRGYPKLPTADLLGLAVAIR